MAPLKAKTHTRNVRLLVVLFRDIDIPVRCLQTNKTKNSAQKNVYFCALFAHCLLQSAYSTNNTSSALGSNTIIERRLPCTLLVYEDAQAWVKTDVRQPPAHISSVMSCDVYSKILPYSLSCCSMEAFGSGRPEFETHQAGHGVND